MSVPINSAKARTGYDRRPSARQRGYTGKWDRERAAFLARPENLLCFCGCGRRADTVDHHVPHRGDRKRFWDRSNWRAWNGRCHSSTKQQQERRGYSSRVGRDGIPLDNDHPFNKGDP